uniref:Uncharacterized protein n=1 Tax=viral metagenome TaxID=1070528 RepID=A0A6M3IJJ5_9ZZZZ
MQNNKHNPYYPKTKEDILKKENEKKAIKSQIDAVIERANLCLNDEKFKVYKEEFEEMRDNVFAMLEQPIDTDPVKDAYYLRSVINTFNVLNKLLKRPKQDLKKKVGA